MVTFNAAFTTMDRLAVAVWAAESVTLTVKLEVPADVGFPAMAPVAGVRVRPAGRVPEVMLQVYPFPVPPEAARLDA